jgi:MoaA/NifB/PqqE/SkfB family radical SAM enzyme
MPFCYAPWTNIDINPQGSILPCCKFKAKEYNVEYNLKKDSLNSYLNSGFLKEIKFEFEQGIWPKGCSNCQTEEQFQIPSKRQLDFERWKNNYENYDLSSNKILTASVAFGNTCNLKCITCNSYSSSLWQAEYEKIYGKRFTHVKFYSNNLVDDLLQHSPELIHIDIPGGEPFISGIKQQQYLLSKLVETNRAKDISLHYTTNVTNFPDQLWWNLWANFKNVDIQLSIDGIGKRYEYIRFPANWENTQKNVEKYLQVSAKNLQLSVSHTISAYNIYYFDEFLNWASHVNLPTPWIGTVFRPAHMKPAVWPLAIKNQIIRHLQKSKHTQVKHWIDLLSNTDDSDQFEMFIEKTKQHDNYRRLNFADTFPELANLLSTV